jgi:hypothetical protein
LTFSSPPRMLKSSSSVRSISHINQSIWISLRGELPLIPTSVAIDLFRGTAIICSVLSFKTHFKFPHLCWISSNNISTPRRTTPIKSPSSRIFSIMQWYTNGKRSLVSSLQPPPQFLFFQPRLCQAAKRDLGFKPRWICMSVLP